MSIEFYSQKDEFKELSNFYLCSIEYKDKIYPSSEHLYQAMKFMYLGASKESLEYAEQIRKAKTPNMAKILANQKIGGGYKWRTDLNIIIKNYPNAKIDPNWEQHKDGVMKKVLILKFTQNEDLAKLLLSTGDKKLMEDSPSDMYWGKKGKNKLGEILMELRECIRNT